MATKANATLNMKLLVDAKAHCVLLAEAGKDVVDFLFSLLALPVGNRQAALGKESMVGCVGNLYASVEKLGGTYVHPGAAPPPPSSLPRSALAAQSSTCRIRLLGSQSILQMPMSSISSIVLLNTFAVKDLSALQEKTVQLGYNEGLAILKASLQSRTVLIDVFLGKKPTTGGGRA